MGAEEKGSHKERVETMQKKFDVSLEHTHKPIYSIIYTLQHACMFHGMILHTHRTL